MEDPYLKKMKEKVETGTNSQITIMEDDMLVMENYMCILNTEELRRQIMDEAHSTPYAMLIGSMKMY